MKEKRTNEKEEKQKKNKNEKSKINIIKKEKGNICNDIINIFSDHSVNYTIYYNFF